jgi:hypothetical protein
MALRHVTPIEDAVKQQCPETILVRQQGHAVN